jgi:capsular polysaccharide biosynthesis protein
VFERGGAWLKVAELEIRKYWRILRRRGWIPVATTSAFILIGSMLTIVTEPEYVATASVIANSQANATVKTLSFQEVVISNTVALRVREQLNLSEEPASLVHRIKVSGGNSNLYRISVSDNNPNRAVAIVNAVADEAARLYTQLGAGTDLSEKLRSDQAAYAERVLSARVAMFNFQAAHPGAEATSDPGLRADIETLQFNQRVAEQAYLDFQSELTKTRIDGAAKSQDVEARVLDEGTSSPDAVGGLLKIVYAGVLGLALGLGTVLALEYLDSAIREPEEVEQLLATTVIGLIPHAKVRGAP